MSSTSSSWKSEIMAVFQKEWKSESRSLSGILTTALICLISVIIVNNITDSVQLRPIVSSGMYWMILVFAASISLPRTFLQEEDNRTADFWRLMARPEAIYWGKALFNIAQMLVATTLMSVAYVFMVKVTIVNPWLFIAMAFGGAVSIASTATLAGAIASAANNRHALSTAISAPLLIFLINLGITGTATSFGEALPYGENGAIGMIAYAVATCSIGPVVYSKIWKN